MTILQSIILGIIEGITEFIPVSSTAHLIIGSQLLKIENTDFFKFYIISIQVGAILSVAVLYLKTLWKNKELITKIISAFLPTVVIGLSVYHLVRGLFMENLTIIASALVIGGLALIFLENYFIKKYKKKNQVVAQELKDISHRQAFFIGIFQSLAVIPGVSRSAATIMGGLALGLSRKNIVEFSFILAMPVMIAATCYDLYKSPISLSQQEWSVWIIGFVVSFITAIVGIKFLLRFIKNNNFKIFGWYRIVIGSLILFWLWL